MMDDPAFVLKRCANVDKEFTESINRAKIFMVDREGVEKLFDLFDSLPNIQRELLIHGLSPYEDVICQFVIDGKKHETKVACLLTKKRFDYFLPSKNIGGIIKSINHIDLLAPLPEGSVYMVRQEHRDGISPKEREEYTADLTNLYSKFRMFCLALNQYKGVCITHNPATHLIRKGKRVSYAAHSVVHIDLSHIEEFKRSFVTRARGPCRRHPVRGHFCHQMHVRNCEHDYQPVGLENGHWPRDGEGRDRIRYRCSKCHTLQWWKYSFYRGDASIGYSESHYEVTASLPKN